MTIEAAASEVSYAGNGITVNFAIPFPFDTAADLKVIRTSSAGVPEVLTTGFTVTGGGGSTGSLAMATAPAAGETLTVLDNPEQTQPTDYVSNDAFPADAHEAALDRNMRVSKRLNQRINAAVRFADGDPARGAYAELPTVAARRGLYLRFADTAIAQLEVAQLAASGVALSQSIIAALLTPQTGAEASAGVTPSNYAYPPGDLRRYGCVGDGSTNDSAAVLAALSQAVAGGAPVMGQPGAVYLCSAWTPFAASGYLRIQGSGCTIKGPASTVNFLTPTANFDIRGVTFDRWASVVSRLEAQTGSFTDVAFIGNRCTNCTGRVFDLERPVEWYRIEGNEFDTCSGGYAVHIGANTYASQDTWIRGIVRGNRFKSLSASGTTSAAAILIYGREVEISGNVIDGVTQSGTGEAWGIYTKARYGRVFGNYINNVVPAGSGDNVGINIKGNTRTATGVPQGYANVVFGNHVRNIGVAGSKGSGIRVQTDDVHVYGNLVEDPGTNCYVSDESSVYRNVRIENNLGQYASLVAGTAGIRIEGYGKNVVATGNTILNATNGAVVTANFTSLTDAALIGNIFDGCTNNIVFDASASCTLDRLAIENNVAKGGTYGVLFNGSAGTVSNLRLRGNDLARASTAVSGSLGTSATVSGNVGYLSGSATYDPANLADGAGATTTVTCTGAVLGDLARASFSLDLQGITLTAWVSSANTVSVRFQNESGGALDLGSGTLRVACER